MRFYIVTAVVWGRCSAVAAAPPCQDQRRLRCSRLRRHCWCQRRSELRTALNPSESRRCTPASAVHAAIVRNVGISVRRFRTPSQCAPASDKTSGGLCIVSLRSRRCAAHQPLADIIALVALVVIMSLRQRSRIISRCEHHSKCTLQRWDTASGRVHWHVVDVVVQSPLLSPAVSQRSTGPNQRIVM